MAFFADLTPYTYGADSSSGERRMDQPDTVNIGWLSVQEPVEVGNAPLQFSDRLAELVTHPVNLYRGWHTCEFCGKARGNGEIRVRLGGVTYVAPVLIHHYVTQHRYYPPPTFIVAVLHGEPITTPTE